MAYLPLTASGAPLETNAPQTNGRKTPQQVQKHESHEEGLPTELSLDSREKKRCKDRRVMRRLCRRPARGSVQVDLICLENRAFKDDCRNQDECKKHEMTPASSGVTEATHLV